MRAEWKTLLRCAEFLIERAATKQDAGDTESAYQVYASAAAMLSHGRDIFGPPDASGAEFDVLFRITETAARAGMRSC